MSDVAASQREWFGHPRGLSTLFFTELWERLSYYGMRGILILFMVNETNGMGLDTSTAAAVYGLYTAGVYLLALPGGWIADRMIGQRKAVLIGGIIIAAGHFTMAIPATMAFYMGLVLIVIGTGFLKPNVSAMVGDLYRDKDHAHRDAGFSIFYMGINIGAFLGPLICGWLGEEIDWHLGFSAAGIGMVLGLIQYVAGGKYLGDAGQLKGDAAAPANRSQAQRTLNIGLGVLFGLIAVLFLLQKTGVMTLTVVAVAGATGGVIVGLALLYFAYVLLFGGYSKEENKRILVIVALFFCAAVFWSGFEQAGSSMNIFAEELTNLQFGGWLMPASWLQSVNPLFIITLAPLFGWLWVALGSRQPSTPVKFALGLLLLGGGFLVLSMGAALTEGENAGNRVSPMWLILTYFLHTTGELCLSPVGLSSITKLSPEKLVGQMMGIWFMATSLGNLIAGLVAGQSETLAYSALYRNVFLFAGGAGLIMLLFSPLIKRLIGKE